MRIESGMVDMTARHFAEQSLVLEQRVRVQSAPAAHSRDDVSLSGPGRAAARRDAEPESEDPRLRFLRELIEYLTGRLVRVLSADELVPRRADVGATAPPAPAAATGPTLEIAVQIETTEVEQLDFAASGVVRTADGREIAFDLSWSASWFHRERVDVGFRAGSGPQPKDPLVFDFPGTADALTDRRFIFDIDADGTREALPLPASGSAFLVFDRNGDGRVNDGSELFGPATGDGFAELGALDGDGNGWIDEGDSVWNSLGVWRPDEGDQFRSLTAARVGAMATQAVVSPFTLRGADGDLGAIRSSGVYLDEDGGAGVLQQVDLFV